MSCSMTAAVIPPVRTIEVTMSMIGAFSRVLTPLVGSSRKRSLGRSAYATATSRSLRSPWASPPASLRAFDSTPPAADPRPGRPPRPPPAPPPPAEPLQHPAGLVEHGPVARGQGRQPPRLALPGEDRERDVVLHRHL